MFNNSGLFMFLFFQLCIFIIMTAVILGIHNLITKKNNKANNYEVLFISTASYSPFAIAMAITYFTFDFSMLLGIILIGMGYTLSLNLLMTNLSQLKITKTI